MRASVGGRVRSGVVEYISNVYSWFFIFATQMAGRQLSPRRATVRRSPPPHRSTQPRRSLRQRAGRIPVDINAYVRRPRKERGDPRLHRLFFRTPPLPTITLCARRLSRSASSALTPRGIARDANRPPLVDLPSRSRHARPRAIAHELRFTAHILVVIDVAELELPSAAP
jgi:hypothetical protein